MVNYDENFKEEKIREVGMNELISELINFDMKEL